MSNISTKKSKSIALQSIELSTAVPEVIGHRLSSFISAGLSPNDQHHEEFQLMWAEKSDVFVESWQAMAIQTSKVNQDLFSCAVQSMFTPWWDLKSVEAFTPSKLNATALSVLAKGFEPIHKATISNAKRLKSES